MSVTNASPLPPASPGKLLLNVAEVAALLGLSRPTITSLLRSGDLIERRVGRRVLVQRASIDRFVAGGTP